MRAIAPSPICFLREAVLARTSTPATGKVQASHLPPSQSASLRQTLAEKIFRPPASTQPRSARSPHPTPPRARGQRRQPGRSPQRKPSRFAMRSNGFRMVRPLQSRRRTPAPSDRDLSAAVSPPSTAGTKRDVLASGRPSARLRAHAQARASTDLWLWWARSRQLQLGVRKRGEMTFDLRLAHHGERGRPPPRLVVLFGDHGGHTLIKIIGLGG